MTRALYLLLGAVAVAAAVLSFAALRDLALLCGFARPLAWLLPVVVDAGAAAGTLVWLGGRAAPRALGRRLALGLLGVSIAANALSHGVAAWDAGRSRWVVVVTCLLSGLAPGVLGAVIHLTVRHRQSPAGRETGRTLSPAPAESTLGAIPAPGAPPAGDELHGEASSQRRGPDSESVGELDSPGVTPAVALHVAGPGDRAAELIAAGAGRRRLSRELEITEHEAKKLLRTRRNGHRVEA